jgi:hypothetical protein
MVFPSSTPAILYPIRSRQGRIKKVTEWLLGLPPASHSVKVTEWLLGLPPAYCQGEIPRQNAEGFPTRLVRAIAVKNNVSWHPEIVSSRKIYYPDSLGLKSIKKQRILKKKLKSIRRGDP